MVLNHFKNIDNILERVGGEDNLQRIVDRFYDLMETLPDAKKIRALHPSDLASSRKKTYLYLLGRFGGENIYLKKYGHPKLRQRHAPFPIGPDERRQWLRCMELSLEENIADPMVREELMEFFRHVSAFIQNKQEMHLKLKK